ncbi:MAG: POT family MFS transporter [Deltaproteobacteria bacterium]|nr:POT family MFS transporter [Deltaproteobacteria bacterium]MBI3293972.1 POT family MFS transporter [Deltaproteobacteria bacterium]
MKTGYPNQIKYIVGNEAAERFSYYGMRSILTVFMVQYLMFPAHDAKGIYHLFISANYFMPLIGGFLADRFFGKYGLILYVSLFYCLGHAALSIWENTFGLALGLSLIAVGAGGIKPCVSAFVGDQFNKTNSNLLKGVYELFYFSVNFGSFFSTLWIPKLLAQHGPGVAFAVPGVLMAVATYIFWLGRKQYVRAPPSGKEGSTDFWAILIFSVTHQRDRKPGQSWLDVAINKYGETRVDGAKAACRIFAVFIWISAFWALFEQHGSSWVLQAKQMDLHFMGYDFEASQIAALNPIMVMILIPLFSFVLFPLVERCGIKVTPLRRMGTGMVFTGLAFVCAAYIQMLLESGQQVSVGWQFPQYLIVTSAEVLVSITGLEFAYTQAPKSMKSTIMGLFFLTITIGNFLTAIISFINTFTGAHEFLFYAVLMFVVSLFFVRAAWKYQEKSYLEGA